MSKPSITEDIVTEQPVVSPSAEAVPVFTDSAVEGIQVTVSGASSGNIPPNLDDDKPKLDQPLQSDVLASADKEPVDLQKFRESSQSASCQHFGHIRTALLSGETAKIASEILPADLTNAYSSLTPKNFTPTIQEKAKALVVALEQDPKCDYEPLLREVLKEIKNYHLHLIKQGKSADIHKSKEESVFTNCVVFSYILLKISKIGFSDPKELEDLIVSDETVACLNSIQPGSNYLKSLPSRLLATLRILFLPLPKLERPELKMDFKGTKGLLDAIQRSMTIIIALYRVTREYHGLKKALQDPLLHRHGAAVLRWVAVMPIYFTGDLLAEAISASKPLFQIIAYVLEKGFFAGVILPMAIVKLIRTGHVKDVKTNQAKVQEILDILRDVYTQVLELQSAEQEGEKTSADLLPLFKNAGLIQLFRMMKKFKFPYPNIASSADLIDSEKATVLIIGTAEDSLALAREIDRQGQVNVVLCDLPGEYTEKRGGRKVFVKKGIVYKNGEIHETKFKSPVEADYVFSEIWGAGNGSITKKGEVPLPGMPFISEYTENKEVAKALMQSAGVATAPSICFRQPKDKTKILDKMVGNGMVKYADGRDSHTIERSLEDFFWDNKCPEIVVKPTDGECGRGVQFFTINELHGAALAVTQLQNDGQNVIVEKRINALPVSIDGVEKDWNLRVFVSRNQANELNVSDMEVRVDNKGGPVNISISAAVETFDKICERLGLTAEQASVLRGQIEATALSACKSIEDGIRKNEKIPEGVQQDWFGVDIIVEREGDNFKPYIIEINDHHSGGMWDLDNILPEEECGRACRDLAQVMARRAKAHRSAR